MKNRSSLTIFTMILSVFGSFALLPQIQAAPQVAPPPDGCYPGFTTAEGCNALALLGAGAGNTGVGWYSLFSAGAANFNTGVGAGTLVLNTADDNTAVGAAALLLNTTGSFNTAVGTDALVFNDTGSNNTATGANALFNNTTGSLNTAIGDDALNSNTTTNDNTAVGAGAMAISTGSNNTALGRQAGITSGTGNNNVYIGAGVFGVVGENDHTYIRNINTTSVSGGGTDTVTVNLSTGLLGHLSSSRRYKENIKPMESTSEALYQLKPATYRYKKEIDSTQSPAFGLIAEEVAEVNPDLVARNAEGQPESVHYEMVNAMLLNEFLKEHKKSEEQRATIAELQSTVAQQRKDFETTIAEQQKGMEALTARLNEQAAQIQKVSAQLQVSKPAPQMVVNKP